MMRSTFSLCRSNSNISANIWTSKLSSINHHDKVIPKIGLEVHAQLDLKSKLFSQGGNVYQAPSNSQLDLLDIALPGTLPKLNLEALNLAIVSSIGLNCEVKRFTHFDRKNYFYSDMPAGYQLTQFNHPIAIEGHIDFDVDSYRRFAISSPYKNAIVSSLYLEKKRSQVEFKPYKKRSRIKQIQLEQDSAKTLTHTGDEKDQLVCDLVDYNRSGACLIEIVFEPDLTSHHEATSLVMELMSILKALGTCKCELQEGTLRVDANVSIQSLDGHEATGSSKVELKNLNSLKALNKGIQSEIERQVKILSTGGEIISETRTFDTKSGVTLPLRMKEETVDYRFVPDPNLPPLRLDRSFIESIRQSMLTRKAESSVQDEFRNCTENRVKFDIEHPNEIEVLCLDLIKKMKSISKRYARDGESRHMFMMLDKLCEINNDKVDVYAAMRILDKLLRKPSTQVK